MLIKQKQTIFRQDYRFDLKRIESVIFSPIFSEYNLTICIQPLTKLAKNYKKAGVINQLLTGVKNDVIAYTQELLLFDEYQLNLPNQGNYRLQFKPYNYLGKTRISVFKYVVVEEQVININFD